MLRQALLLGLCTLAFLAAVGTATAESLPTYKPGYTGTSRPPGTLTEPHKTIWMTEWVACNGVSMKSLAAQLSVRIPPAATKLHAAQILAKRAMRLLYETEPETLAGMDGCLNGILWRSYHE